MEKPRVSKITYLAQGHSAAKFQSWIGTWLCLTPTWSSLPCTTTLRTQGSVRAGWLLVIGRGCRKQGQSLRLPHTCHFVLSQLCKLWPVYPHPGQAWGRITAISGQGRLRTGQLRHLEKQGQQYASPCCWQWLTSSSPGIGGYSLRDSSFGAEDSILAIWWVIERLDSRIWVLGFKSKLFIAYIIFSWFLILSESYFTHL